VEVVVESFEAMGREAGKRGAGEEAKEGEENRRRGKKWKRGGGRGEGEEGGGGGRSKQRDAEEAEG